MTKRAIKESDHYAKQATAWACGTLAKLCCDFVPNELGGWDVETPEGWKVARDWRELCEIAKQVQDAYHRSRQLERTQSS